MFAITKIVTPGVGMRRQFLERVLVALAPGVRTHRQLRTFLAERGHTFGFHTDGSVIPHPLRGMRAPLCTAPRWDLCHSHLGCTDSTNSPRARPPWRQAAVHPSSCPRHNPCVGDQGASAQVAAPRIHWV